MATNSNNITIKLKVDGSEDAVKAVNNVKASVDQITKAQADLIKQKTKEIELDGALRRSLEARGKILKEDMQKARIGEYKSMQEVLRAEREIGSQIKKRAGEIANSKRQIDAENSARRDAIRINSDLSKAEHNKNVENIRFLKEQENLRSAQHRAEINRIRAEKAASQQGSGDRRGSFFAPAVSAIGKGFGISEEKSLRISKFLDTLGRTNLALLVVSKAIGEVFSMVGAFASSMIQASLAADRYNLKIKSLEVVTRSGSQTFGQAYQTFMKFNDSLQSEDSLITAIRTFSTLGISAQQSNQLIEGLRNGIIAMGGDVSEQLPLMALAFKRQESALLDNAGITANLDVMYKEYAKTIGTTVDKLTTQQKIQASIVGSLKELNQYQGLSGLSADSLSGRMSKLTAESERLKRAFGVVAMPISNAFLGIANGIQKMNVELVSFFAMFTKGAKEVVNSPEYKMLRGGRDASSVIIGGEFTAQRMGLTQEVTTRITNKEYQEQLESQLKNAEQTQEKALLALAKRLGASTSNLGIRIFQLGKKSLIDEYKAIITGPERAISEYIRTTPSADAASKAGTSGAITQFQPGRGGGVSTTFRTPGKITQQGITEQTRQEATDLFLRRVQDNALSKIESFNSQADAARNKSANKEIKTAKDLLLERVKLNKEDMQSQTTVNNIFTVRKRIVDLINAAKKGVINQNQAQTMTLQVNQESSDLIQANIKRASQQQMIEYRILKTKEELGKYATYASNPELDSATNLVSNYEKQASAINKIQEGLGDTILKSSAYAEALENVLKITQGISDSNAEAYGDKQQSRLDKWIKIHKSALINQPFGEYEAYSQLIGILEGEKSQITGTDKESEQKKEQIQKVINDATGKMNESLKEAFNKTSDIIKSGIEKTVSVITSAFSGNVFESLNVIGQEVFSDSMTSLSNNLAKNKSIMKSIEESKDALHEALKPISTFVADNIAKPLIDGLTSGLNMISKMAPIVQFGIVGAFAGIVAVAAIALDSFIKMEQKSKEIAENTKNAIEYSIPRQVREQRASIYGFEMRGPIASSELTDIETKMEDARKRVENDKRMRDESGMNLIAYAWHNKNAKEAQHELDKLAESYEEIEKKADEYNNQLNREASLKSSKEMLYDLDQQIAEMNIDNALKMGQITQEEADRQKKLLEISQKRKEFTDQAVDIASGFVDQNILRKYKDNPAQLQTDLAAAVNDFATTGNTKGLEALGITGEEITGEGGLTKVFEKIREVLAGMNSGANMPGSSPDKPMYTQVVNVKDFRLAFPDSAYFRAPSIATTSSGVSTLNGNRTGMGM
jgi:hypothetical protein